MTKHRDRMGEISFWALPPEGSEARRKLEAWARQREGDPKHQRQLKETFQKATALVEVQSQNGAGFPADKQLREYYREYNGRVFRGSLRDMPSSFNVVEAFHKFLPP